MNLGRPRSGAGWNRFKTKKCDTEPPAPGDARVSIRLLSTSGQPVIGINIYGVLKKEGLPTFAFGAAMNRGGAFIIDVPQQYIDADLEILDYERIQAIIHQETNNPVVRVYHMGPLLEGNIVMRFDGDTPSTLFTAMVPVSFVVPDLDDKFNGHRLRIALGGGEGEEDVIVQLPSNHMTRDSAMPMPTVLFRKTDIAGKTLVATIASGLPEECRNAPTFAPQYVTSPFTTLAIACNEEEE